MNWDFIYRGETRNLDEAARAAAGGSFVWLPEGCVHYEFGGPADGRLTVLVHGFSVPNFIWDPTFEALTSSGHRVLRYDLWGRGYSDRPHVRYNLDLFVTQLAELLDSLEIDRIDLVGLSMGGVISAAFTVRYPERVRRLALVDPIGTQPMPLNLLYKAALIPGISEIILGLVGTDRMVQGLASDFFDPSEVQRFQGRYRAQMQYRGFKRAILSTLRNRTVNGAPDVYERLGRMTTPVLLVWGRHDSTIPIAQSASILERVPRAQFEIIEGAGHLPNCEKPEVFHPILLKFLDAR